VFNSKYEESCDTTTIVTGICEHQWREHGQPDLNGCPCLVVQSYM
jgi:hypothetical protein